MKLEFGGFVEKIKRIAAESLAAGRPVDDIPVNEFYAPSRIDLSHGRYVCIVCIDGVYDANKDWVGKDISVILAQIGV